MPLPVNVQMVLLHGRYVLLNGDPVFPGYVTFSSQIRIRNPNADTIILPVSIRCDLDSNGEFTVELPTTNDPDNIPDDWTYTVEERFQSWTRVYGLKLPTTLPTPPTVVEFADLVTTLPDVVGGTTVQVDWVNVTGKPTTFTPSTHIHPVAEVNTLQTQLDSKSALTHNHDASYSAAGHQHDSSYSPLSHSHIQGDVTGLEVSLASKLDPGDIAIAPANDQSALTLRGNSGSQTAPVVRIQNHDGTFNILEVSYPSATFNVPINVPYFTVSNSFIIDGSGRRFYWSDSDPDTLPLGIAPVGSIWIDGPNLTLKKKTSSGPEVWTAQTTGGPHTHVEADITDFAHSHPQADITSLVTDLSGKAATVHVHSGADVTSGTVAFARLPTGTSSSQVAIGDHNHSGVYSVASHTHNLSSVGGFAASHVTSDFTTTSTSQVDVTGLAITSPPIGTYEFELAFFWQTTGTAAITFGLAGPSATYARYIWQKFLATTYTNAQSTSYTTTASGTPVASTPYLTLVKGIFVINTSNADFRATINATSTFTTTVFRGSYIEMKRIA